VRTSVKLLFNMSLLVFVVLTLNIAIAIQTPSLMRNPSALGATWLIESVNVVDAEENNIFPNQNVWIKDGLIECIGSCERAPETTKRINGKGKYLLPGLIDSHVHLNDISELAANLVYGVTTIRNMGGYPFHLRLKREIEEFKVLGPKLITTGPILNSNGPNENIIQKMVNSPEQAEAEIQRQFDAGFDQIKVYSNLKPEVFNVIIDTANKLDIPITGHSPEGERYQGVPHITPFEIPWKQSLGRGFNTLEHIETIVWHGLKDDLDIEKMKVLAKELKESGETVTPTLIAHRRLVYLAQSKGNYLHHEDSAMLNPLVEWSESGSIEYWSNMNPNEYELPHADFFLKGTKTLHEHGVNIIAGSDAGGFALTPGRALHEEMALLYQAGLQNHEVLQAATINAARALKIDKLGLIKEGYIANLLIINGNPLEDLSHAEEVQVVFIDGLLLNADKLNGLREVAKEPSFIRSLIYFIEMKWYQTDQLK